MGGSGTPIAADIVVLGPPENTRGGDRSAVDSTPQMAALRPKCGGSPASVVENAIACGRVTTASVSPTRALRRRAGRIRGNAAATVLIGALVLRLQGRLQCRAICAAERLGVLRQGRHHGHHQPLPRGYQRALLVPGWARQRADVVADIAAGLVVEAALFAERHVAADEAGHHRVDAVEIHARVQGEGIGSGQRRVDHLAVYLGAEPLRTMAARAFLPVEMRAANVVVAEVNGK